MVFGSYYNKFFFYLFYTYVDDYRKEVVKQNHIDLIIKRLKTKEEVAQKGLICILTVLAKEGFVLI